MINFLTFIAMKFYCSKIVIDSFASGTFNFETYVAYCTSTVVKYFLTGGACGAKGGGRAHPISDKNIYITFFLQVC